MTDATPTLLLVIQADREAASQWFDRNGAEAMAREIRSGRHDTLALVQDFASHRRATSETSSVEGR